MTELDNSWKTTSGLPDDFDATITDVLFTKDAKVDNGKTLFARFTLSGPDLSEPQVVDYKLGTGWESVDGGKTARDEGGQEDRSVNSSSKFGKLISAVTEKLGIGESVMMGRGRSTVAATWVGLSFHWNREYDSFVSADDGKEIKFNTLLPTAYLGADGAVPAGAPAQSAAEKIAAMKANATAPDLRSQLVDLAKTHANNESFVDAAIAVPGIDADPALLDEIANGAIFAEAHK